MYTIKHGPHEDRIAMRRGIGQGCSLSPSLYSIFTIWFFDQLSEITSPEWAQACVTLFADDSHLAWLISSQQDLDFRLCILRPTPPPRVLCCSRTSHVLQLCSKCILAPCYPEEGRLKYINPSVNVFSTPGPGTTDADPHITCYHALATTY